MTGRIPVGFETDKDSQMTGRLNLWLPDHAKPLQLTTTEALQLATDILVVIRDQRLVREQTP